MLLDWSELLQIRERIPVVALNVCLDTPCRTLPLIGESPQAMERHHFRRWFRIGSHQFLHTYEGPTSSDAQDVVRFDGFCWASSDGAFARAMTGDTFFDDGATSVPPTALLPDGSSYDWQSIARLGEKMGGRLFDVYTWEFGRAVEFDRFSFRLGCDTNRPI